MKNRGNTLVDSWCFSVFSLLGFLCLLAWFIVGNILSLLDPLLLIPSWCRVRRHQRGCCRWIGSPWMDVSILRGLRSLAPEDGNVHPMASSSSAAASMMKSHTGSIARVQEGLDSRFAFAYLLTNNTNNTNGDNNTNSNNHTHHNTNPNHNNMNWNCGC